MKNRAKCKLCKSIIESFHDTDYVECKCGEIAVSGNPASLYCSAKDWNNFMRIDDLGNEIIVKVKENSIEPEIHTKSDLLRMLDTMIQNIESLPQEAMTSSINHYDFCSALILLSSILRSERDCKPSN